MTNKILDCINHTYLHGQDRAKIGTVNFSYSCEPNHSLDRGRQYLYRAKVEVVFDQYVDHEVGYSDHNFSRARSAIARYIYEDVLDGLYQLRNDLWSEGVEGKPTLAKVNQMIKKLSGEVTYDG